MNLTGQPPRQRKPRDPDPSYLRSFKGRACESCGAQTETVVPAHFSDGLGIKGKGVKVDDALVCALCMVCHDWLDHGPQKDREWVKSQLIDTLLRARYELWRG